VTLFFWVFAGIAIGSALLCITRKSPVASALWLVNTLFNLAAIYVLLDAHFIAAVQVLVYAGAIMVLFLFVIMLLNLGRAGPSDIKGPWGRVVAGVGGLVLVGDLVSLRLAAPPGPLVVTPGTVGGIVTRQGAVRAVAQPLFQGYLVPFEITSVLLLAAIVGAVVLAKRRL
jgi:NADH-quinone oxidoreductase subunit J